MKKNWILFFLWGTLLNAQIEEPVIWNTWVESVSENQFLLHFKASIAPKWHLYSQFSNEEGALPTEFVFEESPIYTRDGGVLESESITDYDSVFEMDLTFFNNEASFKQEIIRTDPSLNQVSVEVNYQACDDKLCIFRSETFDFSLDGGSVATGSNVSARDKELTQALQLNLLKTEFLSESGAQSRDGSFLTIFFLGFVGGLLALLTPCVFPMIPLTVSFFLKQSSSRSKGVTNALFYTFSILFIYGLLSLPFHLIDSLNPEILNSIATNVTLNMIFFGVFVFFAFSFFGFYELTLPSGWGSKTDQASNFGGKIGIFFMALTLAIVSFSCTGPILGSLLAGSLTSEGGAMQLSVGMLGFGFALGLPFGLFALFPNSLQSIPKSGGWMTTVKIVLGFLELGLALKFLSNADLVAHWGVLKRETFIAIWALLSLSLTLYLFGLFRGKTVEKKKVSKGRLGMAVLTLLFTSYLIVGLVSKENKLRLLSGFPPPEFYSLKSQESDCPLGLDCYKDFEIGWEVAQRQQKPVLLDFTGWACVNCRKMEENVWSDDEVYRLLRDEFVIISLYVDDRKELLDEEQFTYLYANGKTKMINTIGKKWATFQAVNFQTASQPFYVQIQTDGTLLNNPIQYSSTTEFKTWLKKGLENQRATPKANYLNF